MAKRKVKRSSPAKKTGLTHFYHNNKNATHGLLAGGALFVLKGVVGLLGIVGLILVALSVFSIAKKHLNAK